MFRLFIIPIMVLLMVPPSVSAAAPMAMVQVNVNRVLEVLRDPVLKADAAKEAKKQKLRAIYDTMFDPIELSRRTLALNWNKLNPAERQEFVNLYKQVLEKAYIDKILDYTNEKILFDKEIKLAENQNEVRTRIVTASTEIPIAYRVIKKEADWKVYDVVIENVSLVQNYRSQFSDILAKDTPAQLLEILRKR